jgi:hypothetical protein
LEAGQDLSKLERRVTPACELAAVLDVEEVRTTLGRLFDRVDAQLLECGRGIVDLLITRPRTDRPDLPASCSMENRRSGGSVN